MSRSFRVRSETEGDVSVTKPVTREFLFTSSGMEFLRTSGDRAAGRNTMFRANVADVGYQSTTRYQSQYPEYGSTMVRSATVVLTMEQRPVHLSGTALVRVI